LLAGGIHLNEQEHFKAQVPFLVLHNKYQSSIPETCT
jgi:hypothetical protein